MRVRKSMSSLTPFGLTEFPDDLFAICSPETQELYCHCVGANVGFAVFTGDGPAQSCVQRVEGRLGKKGLAVFKVKFERARCLCKGMRGVAGLVLLDDEADPRMHFVT